MAHLLVPVAVVANGLAAGVLLWSVIGGVPLLMLLPADRYIRTEQFWGTRYEPFQPICVALTALSDVALAVLAPDRPARPPFALAALFMAAVIVISATRNVPMKRWVMSLDPDALPADWEQLDPRRRWAGWNLARTALAVLALAINAVGIGIWL